MTEDNRNEVYIDLKEGTIQIKSKEKLKTVLEKAESLASKLSLDLEVRFERCGIR